jgi:hypothetical protein
MQAARYSETLPSVYETAFRAGWCGGNVLDFYSESSVRISVCISAELCATNRKVAGSIPSGVIGIFHWRNPSGRTMALESTQPLTEMSTRNISCGIKVAGA